MATTGVPVLDPSAELVQVWFRMFGGAATAFGMGAEVLSPGRVRLPSAPWPRLNAAKGDIFRAQRDLDGKLWVQEKLESSGYCAIALTLASDDVLGPLATGTTKMLEMFADLCVTGSGMFGIAVIDVPPDVPLGPVRRLLHTGQREGWWDYEELCTTEAWENVDGAV